MFSCVVYTNKESADYAVSVILMVIAQSIAKGDKDLPEKLNIKTSDVCVQVSSDLKWVCDTVSENISGD